MVQRAIELLSTILPSPATVWGLVPRAVGLVFVLAHLSLVVQVRGLAGDRGISPIRSRLRGIQQHYGGWRRFFDHPTLLWLSPSDAMLVSLGVMGIAGGAWAVIGGPYATIGILVAWLCWLSLEPCGLSFPWDVLLLEAGFLSLLLPATPTLPAVATATAPHPWVAFLFMWLVARLMWGFAKVKFVGTKPTDKLYLQTFFVWMPVPHPLGWWAHQMPRWFHRASLAFMWVAEVVAPGLVLFAGWPRLVGAALLCALMLGIQLTGNWGFFNLGYILIGLCLLDVGASLTTVTAAQLFGSAESLSISIVCCFLFALSLVQFVVNSWVSRCWVFWPLWDRFRYRKNLVVNALLGLFRVVLPFRIVGAYGVFPPNTAPPLRITPVFEGSVDGGQTWQRYGYRHLPWHARARPPIVAPHHPRLDHAIYYAPGGLGDTSLIGGLVGGGSPTNTYLRYGVMDRVVERLLEGEPRTHRLLGLVPFDRPPDLVRLGVYAFAATTPAERRRTGAWWHERRVGNMVLPRAQNPHIWTEAVPPPELGHPDALYWKQRSAAMRALDAAEGPSREVVRTASDLRRGDVERFWTTFVPFVQQEFGRLDAVAQRERRLRQTLDDDTVVRMERLLERYAWLLRRALEPHRFGGVEPRVPRMPNFRYSLCLHAIVVGGEQAFEAALRDPAATVARLSTFRTDEQLYALSLLRLDAVELTVRSLRWAMPGTLLTDDSLPSVLEFAPRLMELVPRDEDWRPDPVQNEDGSWTLGTETWPGPAEAGSA